MNLITNVKSYTDTQILEKVKSLDTFTSWPIGYFDVWIRSNEDAHDLFDDKVYTFHYKTGDEKPKFKMVTSGTTNSGAFGLSKWFTYNAIGCAILKSDVIIYDSHKLGYHKGKYKSYIQNKPFPYYRDNNKNKKAEEIGPIYSGIIGANCHKAGWLSKIIGKWSLGCLVRNIAEDYNKWMFKLKGQKLLTVAILKEF